MRISYCAEFALGLGIQPYRWPTPSSNRPAKIGGASLHCVVGQDLRQCLGEPFTTQAPTRNGGWADTKHCNATPPKRLIGGKRHDERWHACGKRGSRRSRPSVMDDSCHFGKQPAMRDFVDAVNGIVVRCGGNPAPARE